MQIVLFRHGPAGKHDAGRWPDDRLRPLTVRGRERTGLAARGLAALLVRQPTILASSLKRAKQTADLLSKELGGLPVELQKELEPGGAQKRLIQQLAARKSDETVVLVGHEPDLGTLAGSLVMGVGTGLPLKKAGACAIQFVGAVETGRGRLIWFLPPRLLRRLASSRKKVG